MRKIKTKKPTVYISPKCDEVCLKTEQMIFTVSVTDTEIYDELTDFDWN